MPKSISKSQIPNPYQPESPWPCMRGNIRSNGRPMWDLRKWKPDNSFPNKISHFRTGSGIFSTPVIGGDETIYVGSGDKNFYAFDPQTGKTKWSFKTGEVIDSAACIADDDTIYVPSADACIYGLNAANGKELWRFDILKNRELFSPSTIYWWEGNVVLGPNGKLFAGNDDFIMYSIEPKGRLRWGTLTGLHIWSAPSFGLNNEVYVSSFDMNLYAFDADSGEVIWKTDTGNFVSSTAAVADDGTLYFGSFDGQIYAVDGANGRIRWKLPTGGHVYASPALDEKGIVYIGSADGLFYAIDPVWKKVLWTFYTGDPIRSSAALGPDPTGKEKYLIYFGAGNGTIYALDPKGQRRWSYDTLVGAPNNDFPNINASMAIGRHGIATASASGDVLYIPYHYAQENPKAPGINTRKDDGYPKQGAFWYYISPGGTPATNPLPDQATDALEVYPGETISLRLVDRENGQTNVANIDPASVKVTIEPPIPHEVNVLSDSYQINILPGSLEKGEREYTIDARAGYNRLGGGEGRVFGQLKISSRKIKGAPPIERLPDMPFRISNFAIYGPSIVPSFDQIGLDSLSIDVCSIEVDPNKKTAVLWGVQKFGVAEDGEGTVGVPNARYFVYAFAGAYKEGNLIAECTNCQFEITAFPVPLDRLRFSGTFGASGALDYGRCLEAEVQIKSLREYLLGSKLGGLSSAKELAGLGWRALRSGGELVGKGLSFARSWFPEGSKTSDIFKVIGAASMTLPIATRMLLDKTYMPWRLVDDAGRFTGVGTFKSLALPVEELNAPFGIAMGEITYDQAMRRVRAELQTDDGFALGNRVLGIVLIDTTSGTPVPIDYNQTLRVKCDDNDRPAQVTCDIPFSVKIHPGRTKAIVLIDLHQLGELLF